jgi:hypothetical protein
MARIRRRGCSCGCSCRRWAASPGRPTSAQQCPDLHQDVRRRPPEPRPGTWKTRWVKPSGSASTIPRTEGPVTCTMRGHASFVAISRVGA